MVVIASTAKYLTDPREVDRVSHLVGTPTQGGHRGGGELQEELA